jgi:predicted DNA-binding transcriptional regulator AlpA
MKEPDTINKPTTTLNDDAEFELLTEEQTCALFGGIHPSSLRRGIPERYPPPVKIGPKSNRWLKSECVQTMRRMIAGRSKK